VIRAAGDQGDNGRGDPEREAADVHGLLRANDLDDSGLSNAQPIGALGQDSGSAPGEVQAPSATPPSPASAAGTPSASAAGSSQAVPLVLTPPGRALGVPTDRVCDLVFADLEGAQSVALSPTAGPPWTR
jgi:hypothetical protein